MTKTTLRAGVLATVLLFLVGLVPSAGAEPAASWPGPRLGPEFKVTSDVVVGGQEWYAPDVVYNPNRKLYFVVAHADLGTAHSIHGRHITESGAGADWLWTLYKPAVGIEAIQPAVAYNSFDRDYMVVWMCRDNTEGDAYEIWGRIFDEMGYVAGDAFKIYSWSDRSFWSPRVAYNAYENEYFVAWNALDTSGGFPGVPNDIAGCRISASGEIDEDDCPIIITTEASPHQVDIAYSLPSNKYLAVWVRTYPETSTGNDIYGAVLNWNGAMYSPPGEFAIDSRADDQGAPAVAADEAGFYMVAWEHDSDIARQTFDSLGATVGGLLPWLSGWSQSRPAVTDAPGSHSWLVAIEQGSQTGLGLRALLWGPSYGYPREITILDAAFWEAGSPAVASGSATFMIVYEGDAVGDPSVDRHIYGRVIAGAFLYLPMVQRNG
jgi:hypothetical protein